MESAVGVEQGGPGGKHRWLGWGLTAAIAAYACFVHHGIGTPPAGAPQHWYEPRGFLPKLALFEFAFDSELRALVCFTLPAALLAAGVLATSRSGVARALALACVAATLLFLFYGEFAPGPWQFFGWRGSAAIWLTAACAGFAAATPMLATSWLRLGWTARLAVYLPVAFAVVAFTRNATGTNEALKYAISPWPAVPVFGIEVAALFIVAVLTGIALATAGLAAANARPEGARGGLRLAAIGAGLLAPIGLIALGAQLALFPFRVGPKTLLAVAGVGALAIAAVGLHASGGRRGALARRARSLVVGVLLAGAPLLAGQLLARIDYHVTREWRAREIIDALERHAQRETLYPDELADLVAAGDLEAIPSPAIGFAFLRDAAFRYQSFGSSFILEFEAPRWVECAFTPPYAADEDDEADPDADDTPLEEAWSCPSEPPELW
jgi:hypothetical protein